MMCCCELSLDMRCFARLQCFLKSQSSESIALCGVGVIALGVAIYHATRPISKRPAPLWADSAFHKFVQGVPLPAAFVDIDAFDR